MTDYFALLDESRRPWLDVEVLKAKYLALAGAIHPDRTHPTTEAEKQTANRRYAELNAAYHCLREPKSRLRHLLELERGNKLEEVEEIPPGALDLFWQISRFCRAIDTFVAQKAKVTSPLLRVQLFQEGIELTDQLNALMQKLNARRDKLIDQMKNLNLAWESAPPVGCSTRLHVLPSGRLERLYRDLSYLTRWTQQLRERSVQLSIQMVAPE